MQTNNYFDESYQTKNGRWEISIRKEKDCVFVCLWNNSRNSYKYLQQYCICINKYHIENYSNLPKYLKKELYKIQQKYFK